MPKKKTKKNGNIFSQIKWGESYTSLFLGVIVIIVLAVLIFSFIKNQNDMSTDSAKTSSTSSEDQKTRPTTYVVKEGDNLWKISEKMYGTGYNWTDIVSANKLENPEILFVGTKLTIPSVKPIKIEDLNGNVVGEEIVGSEAIKENTYKVKIGDSLWDIALRAYGDGYKWTEIAKENNLTNPDIIHVDNLIRIPR